MKVFILAAGSQTRWNQEVLFPEFPIKQLVRISSEELLLEHTVAQLRSRGIEPIIVSHLEALRSYSTLSMIPSDNRYAVSSMMSTADAWSELNVFLLGDVLYSEATLDTILHAKGKIRFIGSKGEIYGVVFRDAVFAMEHLTATVHWADANKDNRYCGKLWTLYRSVCGFPFDEHLFEKKRYLKRKDRITRDFDSQKEYAEWLKNQ